MQRVVEVLDHFQHLLQCYLEVRVSFLYVDCVLQHVLEEREVEVEGVDQKREREREEVKE